MVKIVLKRGDQTEELAIQEANGINVTPNGDLLILTPIQGAPGQSRVIKLVASGFWEFAALEENLTTTLQ